ncbi:hypothetical protein [Cellulomonas fimi]|uniref:Uncharacterized protein n=1 Tax=Cellulomonas fimi TaxID=1708 RepID=A0A7Y0QHH1_CELFI|nr:hypothetical protein [Cellulomonas fimi]NMR20280.1 hypothetical protein [Cellulomonas fimi]
MDLTPPDDARPDGPDREHRIPQEVDDATVVAVGKLTAALEVTEHARGMLYAFHRLTGRSDNELQEALDQLDEAGHQDLAEELRAELVGRNVIHGRWTFQMVEDYDENYWQTFRDLERKVREQLLGGRRHVYEAQLKELNRTPGRLGHEARPPELG